MDAICYVCNEESSDWRRNFTEIKSQHTQTPISQFIRKFLGDFESFRNIDSKLNCICADCLHKIDDYDLACRHATDQEVKLRELLWTTEAKLIDGSDASNGNNIDITNDDQNEMDFDYNAFESVDSGNDEPETQTSEPNPKQTVPKPMVNSTNEPVSKPPVSKSSVVRQGDKLLNIRPMARNAIPKPMGVLSLKDVPIGTLLRTKDGKVFRLKAKNHQSSMVTTSAKKTTPVSKAAASNSIAFSSSSSSSKPLSVKTIKTTAPSTAPKKVEILNATASALPMKHPSETPTSVASLNDHSNESFAKVRPESPPKVRKIPPRYDCGVCGKIFTNKRTCLRHSRTHGKVCNICDEHFKFREMKQHQQHMKWHELNPGFVCQICFYRSVDKPSHKEHMELHTSKASSSLICVLCDKTFTRRDNFHKHIQRTHMFQDNEVLCDLCGRKFYSIDAMVAHKKVHSDEMPYECAYCGRKTKWKRNMEKHMQRHLPERDRPFACEYCDMRFYRKDHCRIHERRHRENTRTESCPFCTATFEHRFHLKQHIERKHAKKALDDDAIR